MYKHNLSYVFTCVSGKVGNPCSSHAECHDAVTYSSCNTGGECECDYYYIASPDSSECRKRRVDDECIQNDQCLYGIDNSLCVSKQCKCQESYQAVPDKTNCKFKKIKDTCNTQNDCSAAVANSNCTSGQCFCRPGYQAVEGDTSCKLRTLNDSCELDTDCSFAVGNSYCSQLDNPPFKICQCSEGWYADDSITKCKGRVVGDDCETVGDCLNSLDNSECRHGQCQCQQAYVPTTGGVACIRRVKVGDSCMNDDQCAASLGEAECESGVCVCNEGTVILITLNFILSMIVKFSSCFSYLNYLYKFLVLVWISINILKPFLATHFSYILTLWYCYK